MSKINEGGPAFPQVEAYGFEGMSLRAYFAGQAMGALLTHGFLVKPSKRVDSLRRLRAVAIDSCDHADALIAELAKESTG